MIKSLIFFLIAGAAHASHSENLHHYRARSLEVRDVARSNLSPEHKKRLILEKIQAARSELERQSSFLSGWYVHHLERRLNKFEQWNQQANFKKIERAADGLAARFKENK